MSFIKAVKAFLVVLMSGGGCEHPRVSFALESPFCPDCGYCVKVEWIFVHCRSCQARRVPTKNLLGEVRPLYRYCRHCGSDAYRLISRDQIDAYEVIYAISRKITQYTPSAPMQEPAKPTPQPTTRASVDSDDVFEAEVLGKTEFRGTKSAFKSAPFEWQRQQNPARYGAKPPPFTDSSNVIRFRRFNI